MDDYVRHDRRLALVEPAVTSPGSVRNARAVQHLKEGFNRRVLMLDASFRFLQNKAAEAGGKPISVYTATDLAIHLNAFYLNLCGALDNLAWVLQYEHQVIPGVDELGPMRLKIGLFGKAFLEGLAKPAPDLTSTLRKHEAWNAGLKDLRDPAAHRIPIYAVPGVLNQAQAQEVERLWQEVNRLLKSGDHRAGTDLMFEAQSIGAYQPLMTLSHESKYEVFGIVEQIGKDDEEFVTVSDAVLQHLFVSRP